MIKNIIKIDLVLIIGTLVVLIFLVGYSRPLVIAPLNKYESSNGEVLFVVENADTLIIDDNIEFSSPEKYNIKDGLKINLEPGKYYWKAAGILGSDIRVLIINSEVNLKLIKTENGYGVVNDGNVGLNVDVYDGKYLINETELGIGSVYVSNGTKFVGGMV